MIYKRKNSKFWYVIQPIKNEKGQWTKRWISTGTENIEKAKEFEYSLLKGVKDVIKKISEKKRVEKFIKDVAEQVTGQVIAESGISVDNVWNIYLKTPSQKARTERTLDSKKIIWNRFKSWLNQKHNECEKINDVSREIAYEYMTTEVQGKSSVTYNNTRFSLSSIWKELLISADIKENVWKFVPSPNCREKN
ncbi:MAG: hypothetical protein WCS96_00370 [Victivallales bacterium]|jgi:hypothetical protein